MTIIDKWLTIILLCLSGSIIYFLPFFSETYYVPMKDAFGFSNTQMGILLSTFGTVSLLAYIPGGWLADRFSPRKLISIALFITAMAGFIFSTIPSFEICVLLYGIWGISTACIFWSALIKATRNWGSKEEQGQAFGFLEGGRSLTDMVGTTIVLMIFAYSGGDDAALSENIIILSLATLVFSLFVWRFMNDDLSQQENAQEQLSKVTKNEILETLKLPAVWLISIIIMAAYSGYWGSIFFTPYATEVYDLGDVGGGVVSAGKYWIAPFAAIASGFFADKIGPAKAVLGFFVIMTSSFLVFGLIPGGPNLVSLLIINGALLAGVIFALRGIYFSLLEQGGIPTVVTGTATGIVSVIGYTPDIFMPTLGGMILDANPGAVGYQYLFLFVSTLSFLGLIAAYVIYRKILKAPVQNPDQ
ncbi:MAG: MFS transporter [Gammaproteobacteria bacterium]|nr:MFS transporter [Gammaproteobacteria bacterium]